MVSCSSLKNQEVTQLIETKAVLLTHLQTKFELNAKRKTGLKKDFIYFKIYPETILRKSDIEQMKTQNRVKDTTIFDAFFNDKALAYYNAQKEDVDEAKIEKELVSEIFKSERERKANEGRLVQLIERHRYYVTAPVFTKDKKFAIVSAASKSGPSHYSIYKKEDGKWIFYRYFLRRLG